jgi:hypothetical protein
MEIKITHITYTCRTSSHKSNTQTMKIQTTLICHQLITAITGKRNMVLVISKKSISNPQLKSKVLNMNKKK